MKNIFKVIAVLAFGLSVISCGGGGNSAEGVANKFLEASNKGNFEEAKKYTDEQTAQMMTMMSSYLTPDKKAELEKRDIKIDILSSEEKDSTAVVKYKLTDGETKKTQESQLDLKKVNDEWKVTVNKEGKQ